MTIGIYKKTATEIMTTDVATIRSKETIHDALQMLSENRLSALPVVDHRGNCVGILSQADLIAVACNADIENEENASGQSLAQIIFGGTPLEDVTNERIEDVMSESVLTVDPDEPVVNIAELMLKHEVHHIPVCNPEGGLLGIISTMDILKSLKQPIEV